VESKDWRGPIHGFHLSEWPGALPPHERRRYLAGAAGYRLAVDVKPGFPRVERRAMARVGHRNPRANSRSAQAREAFRRGYRMGLIASSENRVRMPGRSYPGDRQVHTPFAGGLCAIWARENTRESLVAVLGSRRCYATTGARIIVKFYVRVFQQDGQRAWTSPIWLE
jgi:hypothetical protein